MTTEEGGKKHTHPTHLAGSSSFPFNPYGGSVKYRSPPGPNTRSLGELKRFPW